MERKILTVGIVVFLVIIGLAVTPAVGVKSFVKNDIENEYDIPALNILYDDYTPRGIITINGNDEFTSENGVSGGSGTENDPYIIEGWQTDAIRITGTTAYFIIRDCLVDGDWTIDFSNVDNGKIQNCIVTNDGYWGIDLDESNNNIVEGCTIYKCAWAIMMDNSQGNELHHNIIYGATWGLCLDGQNSKNNVFHHNDFLYTSPWAVAPVDIGSNTWDDGSEGNFWHFHYTGKDKDGDGIGDTPYKITLIGNKDRYPLMNPVRAPAKATINGPSTGEPGIEYEYNFSAVNPTGGDVYIKVEWGDGEEEDWSGPYASGEEISYKHTYIKGGSYNLRAVAINEDNIAGPWGTLSISMQKSRVANRPLFSFLEKHPRIFPILRAILGI